MPVLKVSNGFHWELPGLVKNTPFRELSEKRVTKATRQCLRNDFGVSEVKVSCGAIINDGVWEEGKCWIHGDQFAYRILPATGR
jgi:hypothetical protein